MSTRAPFVLGVVFSYLTISASLQANTDLYSAGPGVGGPDGMCDVWQALFNGWGLSPSADEDLDGCSNLIESKFKVHITWNPFNRTIWIWRGGGIHHLEFIRIFIFKI